jgi:hypothetical protein
MGRKQFLNGNGKVEGEKYLACVGNAMTNSVPGKREREFQ